MLTGSLRHLIRDTGAVLVDTDQFPYPELSAILLSEPDKSGLCVTTAYMKRLGHIFAVLAFAIAFLMGAAGGAMAHVGQMDHHRHHHAPSDSTPSHDGSHKVALVVVAPCCPAAETPAKHAVTAARTTVEVSWHPRPEYIPAAHEVTPDTPPPKTNP
jgi:hypothetical protein